MAEVLIRAACFVAVILMGYALRRIGFFREGDFRVLAQIVLKITLPASIVVSFAGREIDPAMLLISLLGFGLGALYVCLAFLMTVRRPPEKRAFAVLNLAGYNIGNFTLPFAQSFLGAAGVVTVSLFDTGNAVICLGGAFGIAATVQQGGKISPAKIAKSLARSVPFLTYLVMITLALTHISVPQPILSFAQLPADANAFLAMLMIGVGFKLGGSREQTVDILKILSVRYGVALLAALGCYCLLPLALEYRKALAMLVFSPIASAAPAFTGDLKNDVGLSSAVNSISILISIVCIVLVSVLL